MYFQPKNVSVNRASKGESSNQVDSEAFKLHQNEPRIPSMIELLQKSGNDLTHSRRQNFNRNALRIISYYNQKKQFLNKLYTSLSYLVQV